MHQESKDYQHLANVEARLCPLVKHLYLKPSLDHFLITCITDTKVASLSIDPRKYRDERVTVDEETSSNAGLWVNYFFNFLPD
jgi:hypothetical protein